MFQLNLRTVKDPPKKPASSVDHNVGFQRAILMLRTTYLIDEHSFPEILSGFQIVHARGCNLTTDTKAPVSYLVKIGIRPNFNPPELWLMFNNTGSKIYLSRDKEDWTELSSKSLTELIVKKTKVFVVLGLSDDDKRDVASYLEDPKVEVEVFKVGWRRLNLSASNAKDHYDHQMKKFIRRIDEVLHSGMRVVLIGTSAGGSFALNAFHKRRDKVSRVINICGRLTTEEGPTLKSFAQYRQEEPLFVACVTESEKILQKPSLNLYRKFYAFVPIWDELVPVKSMFFSFAKVRKVKMVEHLANIASVFLFHREELMRLIKYD